MTLIRSITPALHEIDHTVGCADDRQQATIAHVDPRLVRRVADTTWRPSAEGPKACSDSRCRGADEASAVRCRPRRAPRETSRTHRFARPIGNRFAPGCG